MDSYLYYKFIHSISQFNVLPVTSKCNFACLFCSHKQNPPDIKVFKVSDLSLSALNDIIGFLEKDRKIVIGESATGIIEGEPFCNPHLIEILKVIRNKFPDTPFHITTNGSFLNEKIILELKKLEPVEMQISVNITEPSLRKKLLGRKAGEVNLKLLHQYEIPFSTSIVVMPRVTGYKAIEETIFILDKSGCEVIKLFWPSFTKFTSSQATYMKIDFDELKTFYGDIKEKIWTPLLLEPSLLNELTAFTEGCIKGSPGDMAGIRQGDEIISIKGYKPVSRVDAYNKINNTENPIVKIKRKDEVISVAINKKKSEKSGLTFLYDLAPETVKSIKKTIKNLKAECQGILTSELAYPLLNQALRRENIDGGLMAVKNHSFGGNIISAGLLTVEDMIFAINDQKTYNHFILPSIPFDEKGLDLKGTSYLEISRKTAIPVTLCY